MRQILAAFLAALLFLPSAGRAYNVAYSPTAPLILVEFDINRSWNYAESFAQSTFGTNLAAINSAADQQPALDLIAFSGFSFTTPVWFGGYFTGSSCSNIAFADGTAWSGYENFASGEPNLCLTQKGLAMQSDGKWINTEQAASNYRYALINEIEETSTVPLPASGLLLGGGMAGLAGLRRRLSNAQRPS